MLVSAFPGLKSIGQLAALNFPRVTISFYNLAISVSFYNLPVNFYYIKLVSLCKTRFGKWSNKRRNKIKKEKNILSL